MNNISCKLYLKDKGFCPVEYFRSIYLEKDLINQLNMTYQDDSESERSDTIFEQPSRKAMLTLFSCYGNGSNYYADGKDSKN